MKLDIGCGSSKKNGFVGVDILKFENVDVTHDLNKFPYPFLQSSIDEIWMDQVLEHLENPLKVMEELFRISKNGAQITIGVPYFRSHYSVIDPTHKNFFGVYWFDYFDPSNIFNNKYQYSLSKFKVEKIEFDREFNGSNFLYKQLKNYANKKPRTYESRLSHILPLSSLTFYLKVIK